MTATPEQAPGTNYSQQAYDDDNDGTIILGPMDNDEDELDMTVLLGDATGAGGLSGTTKDADDDGTIIIEGLEEPQLSATLTCIGGPHAGEVLQLTSGITTMGRSSDNVLALSNDKEISRHHAIVLQESGKFVVQDQNSLNGTFVNDEPITAPHYLQHGDVILVGLSSLKYEEI